MNKTLTALVMTGALALGACKDPNRIESRAGGMRIRSAKDGYTIISVVDAERDQSKGVRPRLVIVENYADNASPFGVYGRTNARTQGATFTDGEITYTRGGRAGCYWGNVRHKANMAPCTPTEVGDAQQLLTKGADYVTE
jgi:hypothetical protein